MNKQLSKNKYYKQAYNNPGQYDFNSIVSNMETAKDDKTVKMFSCIASALRDAKTDKAKGTYKFITN